LVDVEKSRVDALDRWAISPPPPLRSIAIAIAIAVYLRARSPAPHREPTFALVLLQLSAAIMLLGSRRDVMPAIGLHEAARW